MQIGYASGNLGKSILWASFESFLLFYLVAIAGFSAWLAGGVLAAAMIWDGLADLAVAYGTDRHGKANALARLVLVGAPLGAIGFWLTFAPATGHAWPAIVAAILVCRLGYTLCDIGHNTLLVRVATGSRAASLVSGFRLIFSSIGGALVGIAAARLFGMRDVAAQREAFGICAAIAGALYLVTLLIAVGATRRLPAPSPVSAAAAAPGKTGRHLLRSLWRQPGYRLLLGLIAVQAGLLPAFNRALPFFGTAVRGDPAWAGYALATITLAQSLSLPLWMAASRHVGPARLLAAAHLLALVAMASMILLSFLHDEGWSRMSLVLLGTAQAGMNLAIWALLALSIQSRSPGQMRLEALPVGLFLAVLKCASGLGSSVIAVLVGSFRGWSYVAGGAIILPMMGCLAILTLLRRDPGAKRPPPAARTRISQ
ncbi:MFS transporter [Sphingomonas sp. TDK1]|uniref:MFS transporter n=1 Tax=Sphingomonas sp. TDK1 TaxID=453247 RepID=UPI0018DD8291|nr:MFS transporter [Sphingomonas sp. TDK1]